MESLQYWGLMGEFCIKFRFVREVIAGIYYDILGRVCGRLAAGRGLLQRLSKYACPAWGYFSVKKSNQKSFRAPP